MAHTYYTLTWHNPHACGDLPGQFATEKEAKAAGEEWLQEMCAIENPPLDPDAEDCPYAYEAVEVECEGCKECCTDDCEGCAYCYEDDSPQAMGWVDAKGRP